MTPGKDDDAALVARLKKGDTAAFDEAYARLHARVLGFLLRLARRRDVAEDLAQETWIKLARAAPTLRDDTALAPFLFTIARNAFVSHRRWAMLDLSRLLVLGFEAASAAAAAPSPDVEYDRAHELALLDRALGTLSVGSREVLLLVGVEGFDQEEAARVLGITYEALRQRLSRARGDLAKAMEKLERNAPRAPAASTKLTKGETS